MNLGYFLFNITVILHLFFWVLGVKLGGGLETVFEDSCDESFDSAMEKEQEKVEERDDGINMGWNVEVGNGENANIFIINVGLNEELRRWRVFQSFRVSSVSLSRFYCAWNGWPLVMISFWKYKCALCKWPFW